MPDTSHETSRPIIEVIEQESAAFWNDSFHAGWPPAGPDEAGSGASAAHPTRVA